MLSIPPYEKPHLSPDAWYPLLRGGQDHQRIPYSSSTLAPQTCSEHAQGHTCRCSCPVSHKHTHHAPRTLVFPLIQILWRPLIINTQSSLYSQCFEQDSDPTERVCHASFNPSTGHGHLASFQTRATINRCPHCAHVCSHALSHSLCSRAN